MSNEAHLSVVVEELPDESGAFTGYAAIYNTPDSYGRIFLPGSFDEVLARMAEAVRYPGILWEHNKNLLIGSQVLSSDERGLRVEGQLFIADGEGVLAVEDAKKAYNLIRTSVYGMSIRAPYRSDDAYFDAQGFEVVTRFLDIRETSVTVHPAHNNALVEAVASQTTLDAIAREVDAWHSRVCG